MPEGNEEPQEDQASETKSPGSSDPKNEAIALLPAVNAVILNANGEVLLTLRSAKVREPGKWCLPGGHLDPREGWLDALKRELSEEVGIAVDKAELLGIYSDPDLTVTPEPLSSGTRGQYVVATFLVKEFNGEIEANDEVEDWDWFDPRNLPEPILRSHPVRVQDAMKFKQEVFVR